MTDAAVVILNHNGRHMLAACLGALAHLGAPADIIFADNGSTDDSLEYVRARHPGVRRLDLGHNLGFAAGYNQALQGLDHTWLVLLNNDAVIEPGWLKCLLAFAARNPRAGILGGKLLFSGDARGPAGEHLVQSAGASFTDAGTAFETGWGQPDRGQFEHARAVGAIPAAAMLVRRSVFEALGGFDAGYHAYLEDVDLCWRAWLRGYEVHYVPAAVAFHAYGASGGGRLAPYRIRRMQRNRLANIVKNLQTATLPQAWIVSLAYDFYRVLEYAGHRRYQAARALTAGTVDFWLSAPALLKQRRHIQHSRVLSDRFLREHGLLVPAPAALREYRRLSRLPANPPA